MVVSCNKIRKHSNIRLPVDKAIYKLKRVQGRNANDNHVSNKFGISPCKEVCHRLNHWDFTLSIVLQGADSNSKLCVYFLLFIWSLAMYFRSSRFSLI